MSADIVYLPTPPSRRLVRLLERPRRRLNLSACATLCGVAVLCVAAWIGMAYGASLLLHAAHSYLEHS